MTVAGEVERVNRNNCCPHDTRWTCTNVLQGHGGPPGKVCLEEETTFSQGTSDPRRRICIIQYTDATSELLGFSRLQVVQSWSTEHPPPH